MTTWGCYLCRRWNRIRVAVGLMGIAGIFGYLVGLGASPWFLLVLPFITAGMIHANKAT
jgi:hypothetical protein